MVTRETVATFLPGAAGLGGFWSARAYSPRAHESLLIRRCGWCPRTPSARVTSTTDPAHGHRPAGPGHHGTESPEGPGHISNRGALPVIART